MRHACGSHAVVEAIENDFVVIAPPPQNLFIVRVNARDNVAEGPKVPIILAAATGEIYGRVRGGGAAAVKG